MNDGNNLGNSLMQAEAQQVSMPGNDMLSYPMQTMPDYGMNNLATSMISQNMNNLATSQMSQGMNMNNLATSQISQGFNMNNLGTSMISQGMGGVPGNNAALTTSQLVAMIDTDQVADNAAFG